MPVSYIPLWLQPGSKDRKTVVEICQNCASLHTSEKPSVRKPHRLVVKLRGSMDRGLRGGFLRDKHVVALALESTTKCKACTSKHVKSLSSGRLQSRLWRQCVKRILLCIPVLFLMMFTFRPGWLLSFPSNNQEMQPPIQSAESGISMDSDYTPLRHRPFGARLLQLKEESIQMSKPKSRLKDVHREVALHTEDTADHGNGSPLGLSNDMKVYIYDLPSSFNSDWMKNERCSNHLFAAEVAIHRRLLQSPVRTLNPMEADYFFMPVYVSCNFNTSSGFPSLSHARNLLASAVRLVSQEMPYWNLSDGRDHIFVATHDYGPCFHTMEDLAVAAGIPSFLQKSVILQTFGRTDNHACQAENHIVIPPFVQPSPNSLTWSPEHQRRDIWAYFRGKMEVNPKNVSGRIYSRGVRSTIWHKFRRDRRFVIKRTRTLDYKAELRRSVFCLCPLGWAPWSPRIAESVISGCVPVIIADKIALPYGHVIDWSKISVVVPEKDAGKLGRILDKVARGNLTTIQRNLWNEDYRRALVYTDPLTTGDATWQILELLSRNLRRTTDTLQTS